MTSAKALIFRDEHPKIYNNNKLTSSAKSRMILGLATALDAPKSISRIKQVRLHIHTKAHSAIFFVLLCYFSVGVAEAASAHVQNTKIIN